MSVVSEFHKLYYGERNNEIYGRTYYAGVPCLKCPLDLWIYQEIFYEYKPDIVVETGTFNGGSALWMRDTLNNLNLFNTPVVTVDIGEHVVRRAESGVTYIVGDSTSDKVHGQIEKLVGDKKVIFILDSLHTKEHVLSELKRYSDLVKIGGYIIVEDTNLNGHPVRSDWGLGPSEAVTEFLNSDSRFEVDKSREKFLMSFNIGGYLRRVA